MKHNIFSILIAQYNNGQYFKDCYDSIIAQSHKNWEVIIVDDCSTDDSVDLMRNVIGNDPRFIIEVFKENKGCGAAKRRCAELAIGDLCAFLDPDDAITPEALQEMVSAHEKYPDHALVYSKPFTCDHLLQVVDERKSKQVLNDDPYFFNLEGHVFAFISYKNAFYKKTVGIDSYLQRAVDQDLVFKLYEVGPFHFLDKTLYKYRIHANGISTNNNKDKAYFWHWVAIIDAAKRRNINIENLFLEKALSTRREHALQNEIDFYNKSIPFKVLRKLGLFKI